MTSVTESLHRVSYTDLRRMWGFRTWLLAAQMLVQGGQYLIAPDRPLHLETYRVLRPIGEAGWLIVGALYVASALTLVAVQWRKVRTPRWGWTIAFGIAGALYGFLVIATLMNHAYLPSTLILPFGLCVAELDLIGRVRTRRAQPRGA